MIKVQLLLCQLFFHTAKRVESGNLFVIVQKRVTVKQKLQITKVASVKTAEIDTLVMIDVVVTDRRARSLVGMLVATRGIVGVKIGMGIETDMTIVEIDETAGITTIESVIGPAVPQEDLAVLLESDRTEKGTIGTEDPDRCLGAAEIETNSKSGTMAEIAREIEKGTAKESATISTRILCRRVSR